MSIPCDSTEGDPCTPPAHWLRTHRLEWVAALLLLTYPLLMELFPALMLFSLWLLVVTINVADALAGYAPLDFLKWPPWFQVFMSIQWLVVYAVAKAVIGWVRMRRFPVLCLLLSFIALQAISFGITIAFFNTYERRFFP